MCMCVLVEEMATTDAPVILNLVVVCFLHACVSQLDTTFRECHCTSGCDVNFRCPSGCLQGWSGPTCQRRNIALNKPTKPSSTLNDCPWANTDAKRNVCGDKTSSLAVDGVVSSSYWSGTCTHTRPGRTFAWWTVDLEETHLITDMRIFFSHERRVRGFVVLVDGLQCYQSQSYRPTSPINISCATPIRGQHVTVQLPTLADSEYILNLCEVEIYECATGTFGRECSSWCHCRNTSEACGKTTGHCQSGCPDGYAGTDCQETCRRGRYGSGCKETCGHCAGGNKFCHSVDGTCTRGCQDNWVGGSCKECQDKRFGAGCRQRCGCKNTSEVCDKTSGDCVSGCRNGWTGDGCLTRITDCGCTSGCSYPPTPCDTGCITGRDGGFCHRRNIALSRPTEQTGSFNDTAFCPQTDPHFGRNVCGVKNGSLAVDGNADHTYWHGSCSHTVPHNTTARWSVNLGDNHVISHVVIHTDEDQPSFLKTFQLYVSDQWCQNWTAAGDHLVADITCVQPLTGSNLTILIPPSPGNRYMPVLDLCEVLVYECSDFWFGSQCDKRCHCHNMSEVCHKVTGHCLSGCTAGRAGADCQMINVALDRNAVQSSTYTGSECVSATSPQCATSAGQAVDGDTRSTNGSCSYTASGQPSSYWSVALEKVRDIHSFRIYNNKHHLDYLRGFKVMVDGAACYQASTKVTPPAVIDFNCTDVISGSNVSILLPPSLHGQHILSLCEVEVYECDDFKYGLDCESTCSCKNVMEVCNKTTGYCRSGCTPGLTGQSCTQGCPSGHYGLNCSSVCGHCAQGSACDMVTGNCPDGLCEGWWTGPGCHDCRKGTYLRGVQCEPCLRCADDDCDIRGMCQRGCRAGYSGDMCNETCVNNTYGANCRLECGACHNNAACDVHTGNCEGGCEPGFTGQLCQECTAGLYGEGCNMTCGRCANTTMCDKETGRCPSGCQQDFDGDTCTDCVVGRYGPMCKKVCGHCLYGEKCDRTSGTCTRGCQDGWKGRMCLDCRQGYYGQLCFACGHCLGNVTCNMTSGLCPGDCDPGWTSDYCNQECPAGYYGDNCTSECGNCADNITCNNVDGSCPASRCAPGYKGTMCTTECPAGFYGRSCEFPCGKCLHDAVCNRTSGLCPDGQCQDGYQPPRCHGGCPHGTRGINCRHLCDHCLDLHCDIETGRCNNSNCAPGWTGDHCMTATSPSQSTIQPWGIALAVLIPLLVVVGVGVALWWKCRRGQKRHSDQEMATVRRPPRHSTR